MKNFSTLILLILLTFTIQLNAQTINIEMNKCYVSYFDFDKKYELKEVDCSEVEKTKVSNTKESQIKREQFRLKMIAYQKKLISLGYKVDVSGLLDEKTKSAHNKYIRKKEKAEKREQRKERKKADSE